MLPGEIFQRPQSARGVSRGRAQKLRELVRRAWIKAAIRPPRQPRDLAKRLLGNGIDTLLEHERGHAENAEFARGMAKIIELFFHCIADEYEGLHRLVLRFALGMRDDFADLGVTAAAIDLLHQAREPLGLRHPARRAAFAKTSVIDELDVEAADRARFAKHLGLQLAGRIPHRLSAHCGIECKDQPSALPRRTARREPLHLGKKRIDLRARGAGCRRAAAARCWLWVIGHGDDVDRGNAVVKWPYRSLDAMPRG